MAIAYMTNYGPIELTEVELGPPEDVHYGYTATVKYVGTDILAVVPIDVTEKSAQYDIVFENGAKVSVYVNQPIGVIYRNITILLYDKDGTYPQHGITKRYYPNDSIGHVYLYCDSGRNVCDAGVVSQNWNEPDYDGRITWQENTCGLWDGHVSASHSIAYSAMFGGLDEYMSDIKQVRLSNNLYDVVDVSGRAAIAPYYDILHTYNEGDYAWHEDNLYQCHANGVSGEFDVINWDLVEEGLAKKIRDSSAIMGEGSVDINFPDEISDFTFWQTDIETFDGEEYLVTGPALIKQGIVFRFDDTDYYVDCKTYDWDEPSDYWDRINAYTNFVYFPKQDGYMNMVQFRFSRVNSQQSWGDVLSEIEIRRKNETAKSDLADFDKHLLSDYLHEATAAVYDEIENSWSKNERETYEGAYGEISATGFVWSDWIEGDASFEHGTLLVLNRGWGSEWIWKIGAVYDFGNNYLAYANTDQDMWDAPAQEFEIPVNCRYFEIPGIMTVETYGGGVNVGRLVAFQIGWSPTISSLIYPFDLSEVVIGNNTPYLGEDLKILTKESVPIT